MALPLPWRRLSLAAEPPSTAGGLPCGVGGSTWRQSTSMVIAPSPMAASSSCSGLPWDPLDWAWRPPGCDLLSRQNESMGEERGMGCRLTTRFGSAQLQSLSATAILQLS
ncbi:hypothetical protein BS78_06G051100 [Paspalum vaginatum]|nr:hypothetical protein BS78_06G051100 [Paspalum vaginatum]